MKRINNLKQVLETGTPKQKALLLIENEEASSRPEGAFLTKQDEEAIKNSVKKDLEENKELKKYLAIAGLYSNNRFRFYSLQENLKKLSARIASFCYIWELAEQQAEFCNTLLGLIDGDGKGIAKVSHKPDVEKYIYRAGRSWNSLATLQRKKDKDGNALRDLEPDLEKLRSLLEGVISDYKISLGIAKALVLASDEFVARHHATAFVPSDIKDMFKYFKAPNTDVPELFRRDAYIELLKAKGSEDREVQYREKYAILPAWSEIEPLGLDNAKKAFTL